MKGLQSDQTFVTALKHLCKANVMAMHAILKVQPEATFIQSESSEYFHAIDPLQPRSHVFLTKNDFFRLILLMVIL